MLHPGEVIKRWRKAQNISIPMLARLSTIDKGTISRFERGGDYRMRVFSSLCAALGKEPEDAYAEMAAPKVASPQPKIGICKEHDEVLRKLDYILHKDLELAGWITGNVKVFHAQALASPPPEVEGNHGPYVFSPIGSFPSKKRKKLG